MAHKEMTSDQLHTMIGQCVVFKGVYCQVVEIIEDGPSLVLEDLEAHVGIQPDQHGEAHRRVPKTYTIRVFSPDSNEFTTEFLSLEPIVS